MEGLNRPLHLTLYDRETADKVCNAVAKLVGERPEPIKALIVAHPKVSQAEGLTILRLVRADARGNLIHPGTIKWLTFGWARAAAIFFQRFKDNPEDPSLFQMPFDAALLHETTTLELATGPHDVDEAPPVQNGHCLEPRRLYWRPL
jgi:hypothetical protein